MNDSSLESQKYTTTWRHLLLAFAAVVFVVGCGQPAAYVAVPFTVPDEFSDESGMWERIDGEPLASDNQQIGKFFKMHSSLIGSPEWNGQPEKYVSSKSKTLKRFYWFSGNSENPSWNAIEFNGNSAKTLSGVGMPGLDSPE